MYALLREDGSVVEMGDREYIGRLWTILNRTVDGWSYTMEFVPMESQW